MKGFLSTTAPTRKPLPLLAQCDACKLYRTCKSPKMPVDGKGKKKIMVIAEAPGKDEDEQGKPLVGPSGRLLWETMAKHGVDRDDCWITNACICRPPDNKLPEKSVGYCRPNVVKAIEELRPRVILLLGGSAVKSVIGWQWREDVGLASRWDGWQIPSQNLNAWLCPTWHPSYVLRLETGDSGRERGYGTDVGKLFFEQHVAAACGLWKSRPWKEVPQWHKQVKKVLDPDEAAGQVRGMIGKTPVVFDYETGSRKPDHPDSFIHCCGVSDGEQSIAFPWHGAVIDSMRELLTSGTPKWGWNAAFETRWTRKHLGVGVNNWQYCGMVGTHVLDNRDSITSLGFQAFVRLGFSGTGKGYQFKEDMDRYFKTEGSNERNRIREAPLDAVLMRCGMDALLEWKICELQQEGFER